MVHLVEDVVLEELENIESNKGEYINNIDGNYYLHNVLCIFHSNIRCVEKNFDESMATLETYN